MTLAEKKHHMLRVLAKALGKLRRLEEAGIRNSTRQEVAVYRALVDESLDRLLDAHTPEDISRALRAIGKTIGQGKSGGSNASICH